MPRAGRVPSLLLLRADCHRARHGTVRVEPGRHDNSVDRVVSGGTACHLYCYSLERASVCGVWCV